MAVTIGLRFDPRDAPKIQHLADRWKADGTNSDLVPIFTRAASDALIGEPMLVTCESAEEAKVFAAGFVIHGIACPAIEALQS